MNSKGNNEYENVFSFVKTKPLRSHLGDALKIAAELPAVAKKYPVSLRSTFYKTSIIYLASIIEAILHYCALRTLGDVCEHTEWTYKNIRILHEFDEEHDPPKSQIIAGERAKRSHKLSGYIDFKDLNKLCLRENIIDETLFDEVERVRKLRNKIHLFGLKFVDRQCSRSEVDQMAGIASNIVEIARNKLK